MVFNNINFLQKSKFYQKKKSALSIIFDVVFYLVVIAFIAYLIFCTVFIQAEVIGTSMQPTYNKQLSALEDPEKSIYKDIVYANRFDNGSNGDVVLVTVNNEIVIKRVIATAGQEVRLKKEFDGFYYYYVDNKKIDESYILDRTDMNLSYFNSFCYDSAEMENFKNVEIIYEDREARLVVPQDCAFVLGDNRLVSRDSTTFGCVNTSKILGTVSFSYEYNQNFWSFIWQKICSIF